MREILFRGKRIDNGRWVEGFYIHLHKSTYCFTGEGGGDNDIHQIVFEQMTDWGLPNQHLRADVDPDTVGQFIGLTDKNGKKIFEGDIVRHYNLSEGTAKVSRNTYEIGTVFYDSNTMTFRRTADKSIGCDWESNPIQKTYLLGQHCVYEIIGNIYDNVELLED